MAVFNLGPSAVGFNIGKGAVMRRSVSLFLIFAVLTSVAAAAQQATPTPAAPTSSAQTPSASAPPPLGAVVPQAVAPPAARPQDVASIDSIVAAIYDVISGPAGERDWNRFRSLFIPEARLIPNGVRPEGPFHRVLTVEEYVSRAGANFASQGFFESESSRTMEHFDNIAHVFSTYESRHEKGGTPFARGINSIQLLNDGKRWYVVTILWDAERPNNPIPPEYLKK
jgi:hypothetical protein